MKLSIIIPSFNTKNLIESCLAAIFKYPPKDNFEVIVIDNGSRDGSAKMIKEKFRQVKLIVNKKNQGYSKANNQGFKIAKGKFILLLNSDTQVRKNCIETLLNNLKTHPQTGAVTAKLLNPDGSTQHYYHRQFPAFFSFVSSFIEHRLQLKTYLARNYFMLNNKFDRITEIEQAAGTVLMFKKETAEKIGGLFDEQLPIFFNDTDFCLRLRKSGLKILLIPRAKVVHFREKSVAQLDLYVILEEQFLSMLYFFRKHHQVLNYLLSRIGLFLIILGIIFVTLTGLGRSLVKIPQESKLLSLKKETKLLWAVLLEKRQNSKFLC